MILCCGIGAAVAQTAPETDRIMELERKVLALEQMQLSTKKKDAQPEGEAAKVAQVTTLASKTLRIGGLLQPRYDFIEGGAKSHETSGFVVRRFSLILDGDLHDNVEYKVITLFTSNSAALQLLDAKVIFNNFGPSAVIEVGQVRSEGVDGQAPQKNQFIDYSNSSTTFRPSYDWDRGIIVRGLFLSQRLGYGAQLVNGNGTYSTRNDNICFRRGLFLQFDPLGPADPNTQNDLKYSRLRFGARISVANSRDSDKVVGHQNIEWLASDVYVRAHGFYGKYTVASQSVSANSGTLKDQSFWKVQAGLVFPVWLGHAAEPTLQYQVLNRDPHSAGMRERWFTIGTNYYLSGNISKVQVNYIFKNEETPYKTKNDTLQVMYTAVF